MLKGKRTVIFNAVMLIAGLTGANVDPELARQFAEEFLSAVALGNVILRAVTSSPIFQRE